MVRVPQSVWQSITDDGKTAYPNECCGVLLGSREAADIKVLSVIRCANASVENQVSRYWIAPEELVSAQKKAREQGTEIVGFYHSHPAAPARWSQRDLADAHWADCVYLILSVEMGIPSRSAAFLLHGSEQSKFFEDVEIELVP